jgi:hypothetical protein
MERQRVERVKQIMQRGNTTANPYQLVLRVEEVLNLGVRTQAVGELPHGVRQVHVERLGVAVCKLPHL